MRMRDLSVRSKLMLIAMVSSTMAIAIISIALIGYDQVEARDTLEQEIQILAGVIGDRSTAALSFGDSQVATENLSALALRSSIRYACIYDDRGELFADFHRLPTTRDRSRIAAESPTDDPGRNREAEAVTGCPAEPVEIGSHFGPDALQVEQPIVLEGERIGTILLSSDLEEIRLRLFHHLVISLLVIVLAAGAAFGATLKLQKIISGPLGELAETSRAISEHRDYSVRVARQSNDEVGTLIDAFNTMLSTIEEQSTRLVQTNADLAETVDQLESKNAELERFTYTVSHDLKTPLVTIKGFLGMAQRDAETGRIDRLERDFATIHRAADTMADLLDDLLELSRIGRIVDKPECVSMRELADEAVALLAGRLAESGAQVVLGRLEARVMVDRRRIVEVLQNLIENAIKFSPSSEAPYVEVGQRQSSAGQVLYVTDRGLGIEERYQSQIFEIFERLDNEIPGTGVGLAIVKRIIDLHGGDIWVESKGRGHGSTFCMTLPGCDEDAT